MDFNKLILGVIYGLIAQVGSFFQLQASIKNGWHEKYLWIILISTMPVSWLYIKSVNYLVQSFNGEIWPSRLIGFAMGILVFTFFSTFLFKEGMTLKTIICLALGIMILLVQLFMK